MKHFATEETYECRLGLQFFASYLTLPLSSPSNTMMGEEGLEPSRGVTPIDPKSILSTNSSTRPNPLYDSLLMRREGIEPSTA